MEPSDSVLAPGDSSVEPSDSTPAPDSTRDSRRDERVDVPPAPDSKPPPDSRTYKPVGAAGLLAAWNATKVKCIDDSGTWNGTDINILDNSTWVAIVDGSITLAAAAADTKAWVAGKPAVTLVFNPNSCGTEDVLNGNQWDCAGILIRGATRTSGDLALSPGTNTADMDLIYVACTGEFQQSTDFAKPDDSGLTAYPQLVAVVAALKQGIIQAASK